MWRYGRVLFCFVFLLALFLLNGYLLTCLTFIGSAFSSSTKFKISCKYDVGHTTRWNRESMHLCDARMFLRNNIFWIFPTHTTLTMTTLTPLIPYPNAPITAPNRWDTSSYWYDSEWCWKRKELVDINATNAVFSVKQKIAFLRRYSRKAYCSFNGKLSQWVETRSFPLGKRVLCAKKKEEKSAVLKLHVW